MPPRTLSFSPVAVTMRSASSSAPERSWMPFSVKVSMWSVTTEARPLRMRPEEVSVGHEAQALVPRLVASA